MTPAPILNDDSWCVVLSGGGAKGVYHIGAWKALRELGIPVGGFVGNSIGAIVAAFLAAGQESELARISRALTVESFVALPENRARWTELWRYFVENGGLDTGPLRRLLEDHIDEDRVRGAGLDLGLVTINLDDWKPRELFLDEMEPGRLVDYLMASSAFPGFSLPRIDGKRYVDGGLWDNLPYELARARGWKRIVLLDISGLGWNRKPAFEGALTVYIRNSLTLGGTFDFDPAFLERFTELGYLDTLRAFGRLGGHYVFLRPAPDLEARFERLTDGLPEGILPKNRRHWKTRLAALLDCAAEALECDRVRDWTYRELAADLAAREQEERQRLAEETHDHGQAGEASGQRHRAVAAAIRGRVLDASPYRTLLLVRKLSVGRARAVLERMLIALHPELPSAELYFRLADSLFFG